MAEENETGPILTSEATSGAPVTASTTSDAVTSAKLFNVPLPTVPEKLTAPHVLTQYLSNSREHSNWCAVIMDRVGTFLTDYFGGTLLLNDLARVITPKIRLGMRGQQRTKSLEIFVRILRFVRVLVYIPLSLSIGLVGMMLRAIASRTSRSEMVFTQPKDSQTLSKQSKSQISICSFNVIMFPEFLCILCGMRPVMDRIRELADQLIQKNDDVICLQECWHVKASRVLVARLRAAGYHYIVWNPAHSIWTLNGGQLIASKYPISNPTFFWFGITRGGDAFANKGVLAVTITLSTTQKIFVYSTHTPFFNSIKPASEMCLQALVDIAHHVKSYNTKYHGPYDNLMSGEAATITGDSKEPKLVGTFVCGDYNVNPSSNNWAAMKQFFEVDHTSFVPTEQYRHGTRFGMEADWKLGWDMASLDTWSRGEYRIDWIMVGSRTSGLPAPVRGDVAIDAMGGCSDHLAIRGTYHFNNAETSEIKSE